MRLPRGGHIGLLAPHRSRPVPPGREARHPKTLPPAGIPVAQEDRWRPRISIVNENAQVVGYHIVYTPEEGTIP